MPPYACRIFDIVFAGLIPGDSMIPTVQAKVREFRERAHKSKLLATVTDEEVAKRIYEDAARQWSDLAEKLETTGRPY